MRAGATYFLPVPGWRGIFGTCSKYTVVSTSTVNIRANSRTTWSVGGWYRKCTYQALTLPATPEPRERLTLPCHALNS
ncbi:hypothetical protein E2C01_081588 [Portunus trituberculatus]|uniref:Uncharacterized protein n=1 Tax=Portunus trituberculatus TaxID=210409 RepID=A0A5B7ISA0_PORTR|nr:hypothetical protein [Portunus trituberculatus]